MEPVAPTPQHTWLKQLAGEWTITGTCTMPDGSTGESDATESAHMVGDYFLHAVLKGHVPGADDPVECVLIIGFDPESNNFVGTWIGSPMPNLINYTGTLSEDQTTLTLTCDAPDLEDQAKTSAYRDVIVITSDNTREFHSEIQLEDGSWNRFMSSYYTRSETPPPS